MIVPAILGAAVVLALLTVDVAAYLAEEREHAGRVRQLRHSGGRWDGSAGGECMVRPTPAQARVLAYLRDHGPCLLDRLVHRAGAKGATLAALEAQGRARCVEGLWVAAGGDDDAAAPAPAVDGPGSGV